MGTIKVFFFDRLFPPDAADADLYSHVKADIRSACDGKGVSIIAYGATGSGKTYCCNRLMTHSIETLRDEAAEAFRVGEIMEIHVQLLEIYNENVRDLLAPGHLMGIIN